MVDRRYRGQLFFARFHCNFRKVDRNRLCHRSRNKTPVPGFFDCQRSIVICCGIPCQDGTVILLVSPAVQVDTDGAVRYNGFAFCFRSDIFPGIIVLEFIVIVRNSCGIRRFRCSSHSDQVTVVIRSNECSGSENLGAGILGKDPRHRIAFASDPGNRIAAFISLDRHS